MKELDWYKAASREVSFYMSQYAIATYSQMNQNFGIPLYDIIFDWKENVLNIFRSKKQVEAAYTAIGEMKKEQIVSYLQTTDSIYKELLQLTLNEFSQQNFQKINDLLNKCWPYFIFSLLFGYGSHIQKLKTIQEENYELFKRVRDIGIFYLIVDYLRKNIKADFDPLLMNYSELNDYLLLQKIPANIKNRFKENYLVIMENCKLRKPLPNEINFELLYNPPTQQDKIIGLIACKGIKQGTARIVLKQKDLKLLGPDEILVTPMTAPNYLPYISKVGGIITDDGGTTSHASIISREFQIPCITGTGIATSKIKDGDLILLNANEGYAEIIKKSDRLNN